MCCQFYLKYYALIDYLDQYNLLDHTQSGFRPNHSCETALIGIVDRWLKAINEGKIIGTVMVDLKKKAFVL